ncbi:hypothetical protein ATCC90586_010372 [Pythium insidiosum]|nr:hypothetical protein ATCC90586_010372 [Pythium insidiosum]
MCGRFSSGMTCCPTGEFCQPFGDAYHQCQRVAPQCSRPKLGNAFSYTNIYVGLGLNAEACCEACAMTPGCDAYTYDYEGGRGECALKKSTGYVRVDVFRVWASVLDPLPPCETQRGGSCGNATTGATCCGGDSYCHPRGETQFECSARPAKCSRMYSGAKFDASVHSTIRTTNATTCCEACANTPPCKAFTIEKDSCLLFASVGPRRNHSMAVSGVLNPFFT